MFLTLARVKWTSCPPRLVPRAEAGTAPAPVASERASASRSPRLARFRRRRHPGTPRCLCTAERVPRGADPLAAGLTAGSRSLAGGRAPLLPRRHQHRRGAGADHLQADFQLRPLPAIIVAPGPRRAPSNPAPTHLRDSEWRSWQLSSRPPSLESTHAHSSCSTAGSRSLASGMREKAPSSSLREAQVPPTDIAHRQHRISWATTTRPKWHTHGVPAGVVAAQLLAAPSRSAHLQHACGTALPFLRCSAYTAAAAALAGRSPPGEEGGQVASCPVGSCPALLAIRGSCPALLAIRGLQPCPACNPSSCPALLAIRGLQPCPACNPKAPAPLLPCLR
jgi:hypothetical protein